jgi:plastocyanin
MSARGRRPARLAAFGVAAPALLLASCTNSGSRPDTGSTTAVNVNGVQQVTIRTGTDRLFHPNTITVHPGTVRLVLDNRIQNAAGEPHNLTFDTFRAGTVSLVRPGQKQAVTFTAPASGRYQFVCTIHAGMTGVMVVTQ